MYQRSGHLREVPEKLQLRCGKFMRVFPLGDPTPFSVSLHVLLFPNYQEDILQMSLVCFLEPLLYWI